MLWMIASFVSKRIRNFVSFLKKRLYIFLVKGYIRKGAALAAMREWSKAQRAYEDALSLDANNAEAMEGLRSCLNSNDENPEKVFQFILNCCTM